jgi:deoxyribodipyrimidine photo-lyase
MARFSMAYRQQAKPSMVWFKQDLRLDDNQCLIQAVESSRGRVIPVYILDPRKIENHQLGWPKIGAYRAKFLVEAIQDLKQRLKRLGSDLVVRQGKPEELIPDLAQKYEVHQVYTQIIPLEEEIQINDQLRIALHKQGIELIETWNHGLYHPEDVPFDLNNPPKDFKTFREILSQMTPRLPEPAPTKLLPLPIGIHVDLPPTLSDFKLNAFQNDKSSVLQFQGGEGHALSRLKSYIWDRKLLSSYHALYLSLGGESHSSKFSPWLSMGSLSAKRVWSEAKAYEQVHGDSLGVYQLINGLMLRDFFYFQAQANPYDFFSELGIDRQYQNQVQNNYDLFSLWTSSKTGYPLIDALMQELMTTGFISQHGRKLVSHFMINDLKLPWFWGALCFETLLIDYDPAITYGTWQAQALGHFQFSQMPIHPVATALAMDPTGDFVIKWLSFLSPLPDKFRYQPFLFDAQTLAQMGIDMENQYQYPIVPLTTMPIYALQPEDRQGYLMQKLQEEQNKAQVLKV